MNQKIVHIILLFVLFQIGFANQPEADSSILSIPEIQIQASRENFYSNGNRQYRIDSFQKHFYGQNTLADLLQNFTPAQINSYGVGGIATISLRGTADDQSSVFWNGLKINSPTLGTIDISLLPLQAANSIQIVSNASSAVVGSGIFGGAIFLNHQPTFRKEINVQLRQDIFSFKNVRTNLNVSVSNQKISFRSSTFYQTAKNNFTFYDRFKFDRPLVELKNNELKQWATINDVHIQLKKNQSVEMGNFTMYKHHQIPSIMGSYANSTNFQIDFTTKSYFNYQKKWNTSQFYVRSGYIYDYLLYNDSVNKIIEPYYIHQFQNSINYRKQCKHQVIVDAGFDYQLQTANVTAYKNQIIQHRAAVFLGVKYPIKSFEITVGTRQELVTVKYLRPQFNIQLSYKDKKDIVFSSLSFSDKFRYPDLNDLYWKPGGNPSLKPENGYALEYNVTCMPIKKVKHYQLEISNAIYFMMINNNIVWSPSFSGLYAPQNIKKTRHWGIESTLKQTIILNDINRILFNINYNYNNSIIVDDESNRSNNGNQMRYKAPHTIKSFFVFQDTHFNIGCNFLYVGKRFTDEENIPIFQLKPYQLIDLFIAYKGNYRWLQSEFIFKVNNLTNTSYESVRNYAQPLRNYMISIILHTKTKLK